MTHLIRAAALTAVLLFPAVGAAAQRNVPYVYQGTVHTVKSGSVELIIGVGLALRLVQVRTLPTTVVASEGAPVALTDLKRGDVVRADCRLTDTGLVVDRIEIKRRGS
jgi:hypothetical protein